MPAQPAIIPNTDDGSIPISPHFHSGTDWVAGDPTSLDQTVQLAHLFTRQLWICKDEMIASNTEAMLAVNPNMAFFLYGKSLQIPTNQIPAYTVGTTRVFGFPDENTFFHGGIGNNVWQNRIRQGTNNNDGGGGNYTCHPSNTSWTPITMLNGQSTHPKYQPFPLPVGSYIDFHKQRIAFELTLIKYNDYAGYYMDVETDFATAYLTVVHLYDVHVAAGANKVYSAGLNPFNSSCNSSYGNPLVGRGINLILSNGTTFKATVTSYGVDGGGQFVTMSANCPEHIFPGSVLLTPQTGELSIGYQGQVGIQAWNPSSSYGDNLWHFDDYKVAAWNMNDALYAFINNGAQPWSPIHKTLMVNTVKDGPTYYLTPDGSGQAHSPLPAGAVVDSLANHYGTYQDEHFIRGDLDGATAFPTSTVISQNIQMMLELQQSGTLIHSHCRLTGPNNAPPTHPQCNAWRAFLVACFQIANRGSATFFVMNATDVSDWIDGQANAYQEIMQNLGFYQINLGSPVYPPTNDFNVAHTVIGTTVAANKVYCSTGGYTTGKSFFRTYGSGAVIVTGTDEASNVTFHLPQALGDASLNTFYGSTLTAQPGMGYVLIPSALGSAVLTYNPQFRSSLEPEKFSHTSPEISHYQPDFRGRG